MRQFFIDYFDARSNEQYHNPRTGLRTYILSFTEGSTRLELMQRTEQREPSSSLEWPRCEGGRRSQANDEGRVQADDARFLPNAKTLEEINSKKIALPANTDF
jgi:hypothetical protein